MENMDNSISDFPSVKAFTFRKALLISPQVNHVTIGPQAIVNNDESHKSDNLENEQNSCNIENLKRLNISSIQNITSIQNDNIITIKKLVQEKEFQRQNEVKKKIQHRVWQMKENDRAIQEKMDKLRLLMASDRERRTAEQLAYLLSEEEKIAEQEEINKKQEQELRIQHAQEQNERQMEAYRNSMKEKEEQEEMKRKQEQQLQVQRTQEQRVQEQQVQIQRMQAQKEQQEQHEIEEKEKEEEVKRNQEQQKRQMEEFLKNMQKKEQEEIKRRQEQQLQDQRAQEQKQQQEQVREESKKNTEEKNEKKEINRSQEQQSYDESIHEKEEQKTSIDKKEEELMEAVVILFNDFMMHYQNIITMCNACLDKQAFYMLIEKHQPVMKDLLAGSVLIKQKINSGTLIDADLSIMGDLLSQMEDLLNIIQIGIDEINIRHGTELVDVQTENENQSIVNTTDSQVNNTESVQQADEVTVIENKKYGKVDYCGGNISRKKVVESNTPDGTEVSTNYTDDEDGFTEDSYAQKESVYTPDKELSEIYLKSQQFLKDYEESYSNFLLSSNLKSFRFNCQKAINIPVNTISGISEEHLRDKYVRLHSLLMGKLDFTTENYPDAVKFCKDHLAKKFINQGETLVSSKPEMAFPIAAVVVALWNEHPDFGELFLAHLYKTCRVIVPYFKLRNCNDTIEYYRSYLGYKKLDDDTIEEQDKFLKRMSGLMRLYASITVTKQRKGVTKHHPHGLQHAWRWLAAILNLEPHADTSDLCSTLIFDMLQVAGNMLWTIYPTQFPKLLKLLMEQYYTRMKQMKDIGSGPLLRLEVFLNNALQQNTIPSPHGMLPYNFW